MKNVLLICFLVIGAFAFQVSAQLNDLGQLNTWTTKTVSRSQNPEDSVYLKSVRVAKNKGFDRVVFEFTGGLPRYQIQFVKSGRFDTTGENVVRVGGKSFVLLNLLTLPYPDDPKIADVKIPKGNQRLPAFYEIKELEWFEGVRDFGIGLNGKPKYRIQEFTSPYRLAIDFKY